MCRRRLDVISEQWAVSEQVIMCVFGASDAHKHHWSSHISPKHTSLVSNRYKTLNSDNYVNILNNCVQAETWCYSDQCAESTHTQFVFTNYKRVPTVGLVYVTVIIFTLITAVIYQNLTRTSTQNMSSTQFKLFLQYTIYFKTFL